MPELPYCNCGCGQAVKTLGSMYHPGHYPRLIPLISERFWPRVQKTETCWLWGGAKSRQGYGALHIPGTANDVILVHRLSYQLHYGCFDKALFVCHHCDNPSCVRPDHLFLGESRDNVADAVTKGHMVGPRHATRGVAHPQAKLNEKQVRDIRQMRTDGLSYRAITAITGVPSGTIPDIIRRRTWQHVT